MNVTVIGTGYVGLVSGACLAGTGMKVTCVDSASEKIARLNAGGLPIYEPGLEAIVGESMKEGRLHFTTDLEEALREAEVIMIAVGTPTRKLDGNADLRFVHAAAEQIGRALDHYAVVVTKSTVPAGTGFEVRRIIAEANPGLEFDIASNPEFLREGNAVFDFMNPDRVVIGTQSERARATMQALYRPFGDKGAELIFTDVISSELIKYAANTFLATKVSFINEVADLCEKVGGNIEDVSRGMGSDHRIGHAFLKPGPGYGGSCFPKDTLAMVNIGERALSPATIVEAVIAVNRSRTHRMMAKVTQAAGTDLRGQRIALLGLTFKPDTDDVRDSVALLLAELLVQAGARVVAYDPEGMPQARRMLGEAVTYADSAEEALDDADLCVIATDWEEFRNRPITEYKRLLRHPIMVDLRNMFSLSDMKSHGFAYHSVGRAAVEQYAGHLERSVPLRRAV